MQKEICYYDKAIKSNSSANEAKLNGDYKLAYRLKISAAKNILNCYDQTGDKGWIKIASTLFSEALGLKNKILSTKKVNVNFSKNQEHVEDVEVDFVVDPKISLRDIGGLEKSKNLLREAVEWPLKFPEKMKEYGLDHVLSGVLVYGPPGCGKTLIVEGIAHDLDVKLLEASPSLLTSKFFGESEKFVKKLFQKARETQPSIIFIDEIDKFLPQTTNSSVVPRILSSFQTEMDGVGTHTKGQLIVIMASNEPWKINHALLRPGRCDYIVYIPPPNEEARKAIFNIHSQTKKIGHDVNLNILAELTQPKDGYHYSGSDIANICRIAKKQSMRNNLRGEERQSVDMRCFMKALDTVHPSISPQELKRYNDWAKKYANLQE